MPAIAGIFYGIKPAVSALVVHAAHRIGSRSLKNPMMWGVAAASFLAIFALSAPFPLIVLAAAAFGWFAANAWPQFFVPQGGHSGKNAKSYGPALIDDDTPTPEHARFSRSWLLKILGIGLGLWATVMAVLVLTTGLDSTLTNMGTFFSKAAVMTFGGAYAVLPYVFQGAVEQYQWLTAGQMIAVSYTHLTLPTTPYV